METVIINGQSYEVHEEVADQFSKFIRRSKAEKEENQKLKEMLIESADTIDLLVNSGHISHHPQVELDALTDSMRSVTQK